MSESQERMCAIVEPSKIERFLELCAKWDVTATVIGEVNDSERLTIEWKNEIVVDVPPRTVAHEGPVYNRPFAEPSDQKALQANEPSSIARPETGEQLRQTLLDLIASPNLADKSWVTDQYDKYVQGNTVLAQPEDSGVVRIDETSGLGVAVSTDANARWCRLDPYEGARLALAESYRNVATTGARPLAVTNCLNFGSPEDPAVMWQFERAVTGLADACLELGLPVTGGNVSFYNQTGKVAILPTPVIGVLGVISDVAKRNPMAISAPGIDLYLLGETHDDFAGSEWANIHGHLGGMPPRADLDHERRLAGLLIEASAKDLVSAAHDLSDGGLAITLAEMAMRKMIGATINIEGDPFVALFSETPGRVVVAVAKAKSAEFLGLAKAQGIAVAHLGVTGGSALIVTDQFEIQLDALQAAHKGTFPRLFSGTR
ncbi:phosphoribosylformylglycinamidine synthase 2 [mine drainage metagenome]|uniref:Phosphoribosylformylglycinamidine synthase 2 n=1 Tax=mine drainage metagenome TaxID=410659 RepID=A0A1J5PVR6_9ZZZZ